jgi:hypothetical protein
MKVAKKSHAENFLFEETENTTSKKIGQTIYVATHRFNGNKKWDMASAITRLIEKDFSIATE